MIEKTTVDLTVVLPTVSNEQDACYQRLCELVQARTGITAAHLIERKGDTPHLLCVHHDPQRLSIQDVRALTQRAGGQLSEQYGHLFADAEPMRPRQARRVSEALRQVPGILEAVASPDGTVRIEYDRNVIDAARVREHIADLMGDRAKVDQTHEHAAAHGHQTELVFVALCGVTLLLGWSLATFSAAPSWLTQSLLVAAYFFGGWFTFCEALDNLRLRRFEIDTLMLVAAVGAAFLGEWAEGALLLFLFSLGHSLEAYAMGRAKRAIEALAEMAPKMASVLQGGEISEVPVENLAVGDIVLVRPNERLPADGIVTKGESSINQAPITGESVPVDKFAVSNIEASRSDVDKVDASSRVFAGSINGSGALQIYVARLSTETTLARVVNMVQEAETNQSPTQQFTDRFERIFTPTVLIGAVVVLLVGLIIDPDISTSFYRAMAVLVAASPCALAIATPSAVLSGIARAARGGVLIKGGGPLEHLGRLKAIAFDKTGTLTEGRPKLVDVKPEEGTTEAELLDVAIAVENLSDHPLAAAVVRDGIERLPNSPRLVATDLQSITGRGVQAFLDGAPIFIGKDDLFSEIEGPALPSALRLQVDQLEAAGRTTMIVRRGDRYLGVLGLMDTPRPAARQVVARLAKLGITRMIMLSGDNQQVATAVAKDIGLTDARGDLMPDDKVTTIRELREQAPVAMVGDGVNDAPAMANATVGIAMGAAGSDVALETADVALMGDNLEHLTFVVGLSRSTSRIIRQNLWLSLGIVAILVPSTILGLSIGAAVLVHEGSTVMVVFNALRLLAFKEKGKS